MPKIMQNFVINEMIYLYQKQKPYMMIPHSKAVTFTENMVY